MHRSCSGQGAATALAVIGFATLDASSWNGANGEYQSEKWAGMCQGIRQSPIDIEPLEARGSDGLQIHLVYEPWHMQDISVGSHDGAVPHLVFDRARRKGKIQVGTSFDDLDEYALISLEVHAPSEHTFRHASWAVELQLWHEPLPQLQIDEFASKLAEFEENSKVADVQLAQMEKLSVRLQTVTGGQEAPWKRRGGENQNMHEQTALDWIDARKSRVEVAAKTLKAETARQLVRADELCRETSALLAAQRRPFAAHRVAVSIFLRLAPEWLSDVQNTSSSELVHWVASALSGREKSAMPLVDARGALLSGPEGAQFFTYEGSLTRPPCTPNVRWFVAAQPVAVPAKQFEELLAAVRTASRATRSDGGAAWDESLLGSALEAVQPITSRLRRLEMVGGPFQEPVLKLGSSQSTQKWHFVQRYGKVFFLCAVLVISTPFFLFLWRLLQATDELDEACWELMGSEAQTTSLELTRHNSQHSSHSQSYLPTGTMSD